jgi:hypothetical protein
MMKVLEQATKVLCLAEEAFDKTTKGDWQPCAYQRYWWQMDQEIGQLYGWLRHTTASKEQESTWACNCGRRPSSTQGAVSARWAAHGESAVRTASPGCHPTGQTCLGKWTQVHARFLRRVP